MKGIFTKGLLLLVLALATAGAARAQDAGLQTGMFLGVNYYFSESLYAFDADVDFLITSPVILRQRNGVTIKRKFGTGVKFGLSFGPAWGTYGGEFSTSYIKSEARKQMRGSTLESIKAPEKTDGGLSFNAKVLFAKTFATNFIVAIGPSLHYFTKQSISVRTVSSDRTTEYVEYTQVPYIDPFFAPGIEFSLQPGTLLSFDYGYTFLPEERGAMHHLGISYLITAD